MFKEMEERSEEREIAWEEKRLKFEMEMEEKRREREKQQDDRMQAMFGAFLQQMCSMMCPPQPCPFPPGLQTPLYPSHPPSTSQLRSTYCPPSPFQPPPPYIQMQHAPSVSHGDSNSD